MSWAKRRRFLVGAALVVGGLFALTLIQTARADRSGLRGKAALARAEAHLNVRDVRAARDDLLEARNHFRQMQNDLARMGPLGPLARVTPLVRVQIRGANAFAQAGELLSNAGLGLVDAAAQVIEPKQTHLRLADALDALRDVRAALNKGIAALDGAADKIHALDGYRLLGPLEGERRDLIRRLPRVGAKAVSARDGLGALIDMLGGSGPRRFLLFSQNPDEVRPTGGFIGTYGVLATRDGHLVLDRYAGIAEWYRPRRQAQLPPAQAALPLRLASQPQTLANVNATADFSAAGRLAAKLWRRGGERPVDGVISITPAVMARIVGVLGPVAVPGFGETVTGKNLLARVDYHTHLGAPTAGRPGGRKSFLIELAHVVVRRLLDAPASRWDPLAQAMGRSFETREAMAWSSRPIIQHALAARAWDGTLPQVPGDFFYQGEFEYAAKNGRGLHRTFDHVVTLRADGSARVTTRVTIANTLPPSRGGLLNINSSSFVTVYGPSGAILRPESDPPDAYNGSLAGHSAVSWFVSAAPLASTSFTVSWEVPHLATVAADGGLMYQLRFMGLPAHEGDLLHLHVRLPSGWKWVGRTPSRTRSLDSDLIGKWRAVRD
jgi:hypothetical protein